MLGKRTFPRKIKLTHNGETLTRFFYRAFEWAIPWEGQLKLIMTTLTPTIKSYIAGFLDGDGCVMFQLIRRKDYRWGFQIKASIVFYQKTSKRAFLEWLKGILKYGYIRDRKDGMTEYSIVESKSVKEVLTMLEPYLVLKKEHVNIAKRIFYLLKDGACLEKFIQAAELVDKYGELNYSKKRLNTSSTLKIFLHQRKLYPRND